MAPGRDGCLATARLVPRGWYRQTIAGRGRAGGFSMSIRNQAEPRSQRSREQITFEAGDAQRREMDAYLIPACRRRARSTA